MPLNQRNNWVMDLRAGDCLTLDDLCPPRSSSLDGLPLEGGGRKYHIAYGDIIQVLEVGGPSKRHQSRILCMTREGPIPLSRWLVATWFKLA